MTVKPAFFTVNQVSTRYGVHENTVRKWLDLGIIKGIRVGAVLRISEKSLIEFEDLSKYPQDKRQPTSTLGRLPTIDVR